MKSFHVSHHGKVVGLIVVDNHVNLEELSLTKIDNNDEESNETVVSATPSQVSEFQELFKEDVIMDQVPKSSGYSSRSFDDLGTKYPQDADVSKKKELVSLSFELKDEPLEISGDMDDVADPTGRLEYDETAADPLQLSIKREDSYHSLASDLALSSTSESSSNDHGRIPIDDGFCESTSGASTPAKRVSPITLFRVTGSKTTFIRDMVQDRAAKNDVGAGASTQSRTKETKKKVKVKAKCKYCKKILAKKSLKGHIRRYHATEDAQSTESRLGQGQGSECSVCGWSSSNSVEEARLHYEQHFTTCQLCSKIMKICELKSHFGKEHVPLVNGNHVPINRDKVKKKTKTNSKKVKVMAGGLERKRSLDSLEDYPCANCGKVFKLKRYLSRHLKNVCSK